MIISNKGTVYMDGMVIELLGETVAIIKAVYEKLSADFGDEYANKKLAEMGRLAVMGVEDLRGGK